MPLSVGLILLLWYPSVRADTVTPAPSGQVTKAVFTGSVVPVFSAPAKFSPCSMSRY